MQRTNAIMVRLNDEEFSYVKMKAAACGVRVSEYFRNCVQFNMRRDRNAEDPAGCSVQDEEHE